MGSFSIYQIKSQTFNNISDWRRGSGSYHLLRLVLVFIPFSPRAHFSPNLFMPGIRYVLMRATQKAIMFWAPIFISSYVCFLFSVFISSLPLDGRWREIYERTNKAIRSFLRVINKLESRFAHYGGGGGKARFWYLRTCSYVGCIIYERFRPFE